MKLDKLQKKMYLSTIP
jgi:hypothetical protein